MSEKWWGLPAAWVRPPKKGPLGPIAAVTHPFSKKLIKNLANTKVIWFGSRMNVGPFANSMRILLGLPPPTTLPETTEELLDVGIVAASLHGDVARLYAGKELDFAPDVLRLFGLIKSGRLTEARDTVKIIRTRLWTHPYQTAWKMERLCEQRFRTESPINSDEKIALADKLQRVLELGISSSSGNGVLMAIGDREKIQKVSTMEEMLIVLAGSGRVDQVLNSVMEQKEDKGFEVEFSEHLQLKVFSERRSWLNPGVIHLSVIFGPKLSSSDGIRFFQARAHAALARFMDESLPNLVTTTGFDLEGERKRVLDAKKNRSNETYEFSYRSPEGSFFYLGRPFSQNESCLLVFLPSGKMSAYRQWLRTFLIAHSQAIGFPS